MRFAGFSRRFSNATICSDTSRSFDVVIESKSDLMQSEARNKVLMTSLVGRTSLLRRRLRTSSSRWARLSKVLRLRKPATPLIEWIAQKK